MKERNRGRDVKEVTRRKDVCCESGFLRNILGYGVEMFRYKQFERVTGLLHEEAGQELYWILWIPDFSFWESILGKQIFRRYNGVEGSDKKR